MVIIKTMDKSTLKGKADIKAIIIKVAFALTCSISGIQTMNEIK